MNNQIQNVILRHAIEYRDWIKSLDDESRLAHARAIGARPMDGIEPKAQDIISEIHEGRMTLADLEGIQIYPEAAIAAIKGTGIYSPSAIEISEEIIDILFKEDVYRLNAWKGIQAMCAMEVEGSDALPLYIDPDVFDVALGRAMAEVRNMAA